MQSPKVLNPETMALKKHAMIEASAGTGKTYTITRIVRRLLHETEFTIDQILILTYTEKATAELETRIRDMLLTEVASATSTEAQEKCRLALAHFEDAEIHTIHGFCRQVLARHAFACRIAFDPELVDDTQVYDAALRQVLREELPREFGDQIAAILALCGEMGDYWRGQIIAAARGALESFDDQIEPDSSRLCRLLDDSESIMRAWEDVRKAAGEASSDGTHPLQDLLASAPINASYKKPLGTLLGEILQRVKAGANLGETLAWLADVGGRTTKYYEGLRDSGFAGMVRETKWNAKSESQQEAICPQFDPLAKALATFDPFLRTNPASMVASWLARKTREVARKNKGAKGEISFDDMLLSVAAALGQEDGVLRDALRKEYRIALVDEFQDTDRLQWEILRRVFLTHDRYLMLIGDPKQAIYRFRGADLGTYLDARETLLQQGADYLEINTNWRSSEELVDGLNALFQADWFPEEGITYRDVLPADREKVPVRLAKDSSGRKAMTQVKLVPEEEDADHWKSCRTWAGWIADEIQHLLEGESSCLTLEEKGESGYVSRSLCADDIAILVQTRKESKPIEEALRQRGIPFRFYKKPGVFDSLESLHLLEVLRAIAEPNRRSARQRALLTDFFRRNLDEIEGTEELPASHPVAQLSARLREQAEEGYWARFFQILLEETGVLLAEADADRDLERRNENYRQLCEYLEQYAQSNHISISEVVRHLAQLRAGAIRLDENATLHRQETERPKVQILTMHASKGLQFPVVFLGGGWKKASVSQYNIPYCSQKTEHGRRLIFDLARTKSMKDADVAEQLEELRRLLYVALTRARFKLYLPDDRTRKNGAVCWLLGAALDATAGHPALDTVEAWNRAKPARAASALEADSKTGVEIPEIRLPVPQSVRHRAAISTSFSALHGHGTTYQTVQGDTTEAEKEADQNVGVESLAGGTAFGNVIHSLMETLPWDVAEDEEAWAAAAEEPTKRLIAKFQYTDPKQKSEELWKQVAALARRALITPLPVGEGETIRLCEVPSTQRRHEVEFFYPIPNADHQSGKGQARLGFAKRSNGWMNGSIDLVFTPGNGRYSILDWKTNRLAGYGAKQLKETMKQTEYTLQSQVYAVALQRWLTAHGLKDACGGVYYLFMRGLDPEAPAGKSPGIYYEPVLPEEPRCLDAILSRL